jgi:hypothetical protein
MDAVTVQYVAIHDRPPNAGGPAANAALVGLRKRDKSRSLTLYSEPKLDQTADGPDRHHSTTAAARPFSVTWYSTSLTLVADDVNQPRLTSVVSSELERFRKASDKKRRRRFELVGQHLVSAPV